MRRPALVPRRLLQVTAAAAAALMGDSMLYNVLPSRVGAFGLPTGLVGVLLSANRLVRLASNPLAARLYQRFGLLPPLVAAVLLAVVSTAAYGVARGFWLLLLARVLWGVCYSMLRLGGFLVVLEESTTRDRGRLMGFFYGGQRAGSLVGVLLGGILFDLMGRGRSFLAIAGLGLLGLPLVAGLARSRGIAEADTTGAVTPAPEPVPPRAGVKAWVWDLLISPVPELDRAGRYRLLAVNYTLFTVHFAINGMLVGTLGFFLNQRLGDRVGVLGMMLGIATITGALLAVRWLSDISGPFLGHLSDRVGRVRILATCIPVMALGLVVLGLAEPIWLALAVLPPVFLGGTACLASLDALAGGLAPVPGRRAQVMSRYASYQDLGSAAGPLLAYLALALIPLAPMYLAGAAVLASALALFAVAHWRGQQVR